MTQVPNLFDMKICMNLARPKISVIASKVLADDSGAGATFNYLEEYFDLLKMYGPSYGCTPQPNKCMLVKSDRNLSSAKSKFERYGIKVVKLGVGTSAVSSDPQLYDPTG